MYGINEQKMYFCLKFIYMRYFLLLFLSGISILFSGCQKQKNITSWQDRADSLIQNGELNKAQAYIDSIQTVYPEKNRWQIDSLSQIIQRIRRDFSISQTDGIQQIFQKIPNADSTLIAHWEKDKWLETRVIDGKKMYFRKAISNLIRLAPELDSLRQDETYIDTYSRDFRLKHTDHIIKSTLQSGLLSDSVEMDITFTLTVKPNVVPHGETIRCWLPFPQEIERQTQIKLWKSIPEKHLISPANSPHRSVYMEKTAIKDSATVFSINFSYMAHSQYFFPKKMQNDLKPYNTNSYLYRTYTSQRNPHILFSERISKMAKEIVGQEKNPIRKAALIYDWIDQNFSWAGALEYSTIPNIPEYVINMKHGDCGQVTLLYITMLRSQGIPARWQSGWMLHPNRVNLHDWGEIYFEGIGWVPVDMSFGNQDFEDYLIRNFYKTGIDTYRLAINSDYGKELYPPKRHLRSETVDFQTGEVEWKNGNLFYPLWNYHLDIKYNKTNK